MSCSVAPVDASGAWEHFFYDAVVGVRGFGKTPAESFATAGRELTAIVTRAPVRAQQSIQVRCASNDLELLFADWLNAVIYVP